MKKSKYKAFGADPGAPVVNPVRPGLNIDLTVNQRFYVQGAPLDTFFNDTLDTLQADVFLTLFLWSFQMHDVPPAGYEANRMLLEFLMSDPNYAGMRGQYANRRISAAATAYEVTKTLLENMPSVADGMQELDEANELDNKADGLDGRTRSRNRRQDDEDEQDDDEDDEGDSDQQDDEENDDWRDEDGQGYPNEDDEFDGQQDEGDEQDEDEQDDPQSQRQRQLADNLRNQAQQKRDKAQQQIEKALNSGMAEGMRANAVQEGSDEGDKVAAFLSYWGIDEGDTTELSMEELRQLMALLGDRNIINLTMLMGRVRGIAREVLRGRASMDVMIDNYGLTQNILDMSPDQQALLSTAVPEEYRAYYINKFLRDGGLPGYVQTTQAASEGMFLAAVDESESMNHPIKGGYRADMKKNTPEENIFRSIYAKAIALGLAQTAKDNGQAYGMISFSTERQLAGVNEKDYRKHGNAYERIKLLPVTHKSPVLDLLRWAVHFFNGGTDFNCPLNELMDTFEKMDDVDKRGADLLFITDGQADVSEETRERFAYLKEQWGVRLHLFLIGDDEIPDIADMSDSVISFTNLNEVAVQIAAQLWD
jgi:hypothetical protein